MPLLLNLPAELLCRIAKAILPPHDHYWNEWLGTLVNNRALFNLSLTCKVLADVCLPLLYQHVSTMSPFSWNDVPISMIRTLCLRPDLAAHVPELAVGGEDWMFLCETYPGYEVNHRQREWQISPAEAELFNRGFRRHCITSIGDNKSAESDDENRIDTKDGHENGHDSSAAYRLAAVKAPSDAICDDEWSEQALSALSALAIVKSPNLRSLKLQSRGWALPHDVKPLVTFNKLTEVYWSYADTEGGFHVDASLNCSLRPRPPSESSGSNLPMASATSLPVR